MDVSRGSSRAYVGVIGLGEEDDDLVPIALEVGERLAAAGALLLCGGLGGVMTAAAEGAKRAGGTTVGLLPDDSRSHANPFIDVALATGMGEMRNALIARAADVLIAIGGGYGTLSEIAFALKIGTPVVALRSWESVDGPHVVRSAEEAVEKALSLIP
jgi:uncharacterized protein (TIGR00725 family)